LDLARHPPSEFQEWDGTNIRYHWKQFAKHCNAALANPEFVLFIDDVHVLRPWILHALLSIIDRPEFVVLLATSHWGAIDRSLGCRFDNAVYELRRPNPNDIAANL
jgi:hypothetical protein